MGASQLWSTLHAPLYTLASLYRSGACLVQKRGRGRCGAVWCDAWSAVLEDLRFGLRSQGPYMALNDIRFTCHTSWGERRERCVERVEGTQRAACSRLVSQTRRSLV